MTSQQDSDRYARRVNDCLAGIPAGALFGDDPIRCEEAERVTTTTSYGTWSNRVKDGTISLEYTVQESLGDHASSHGLVAGIIADYRDAINDALPPGVSLCGDEFIGPYHAADRRFEGYPLTEDGLLDIHAVVEGVDYWAIVARHTVKDSK